MARVARGLASAGLVRFGSGLPPSTLPTLDPALTLRQCADGFPLYVVLNTLMQTTMQVGLSIDVSPSLPSDEIAKEPPLKFTPATPTTAQKAQTPPGTGFSKRATEHTTTQQIYVPHPPQLHGDLQESSHQFSLGSPTEPLIASLRSVSPLDEVREEHHNDFTEISKSTDISGPQIDDDNDEFFIPRSRNAKRRISAKVGKRRVSNRDQGTARKNPQNTYTTSSTQRPLKGMGLMKASDCSEALTRCSHSNPLTLSWSYYPELFGITPQMLYLIKNSADWCSILAGFSTYAFLLGKIDIDRLHPSLPYYAQVSHQLRGWCALLSGSDRPLTFHDRRKRFAVSLTNLSGEPIPEDLLSTSTKISTSHDLLKEVVQVERNLYHAVLSAYSATIRMNK